MDDDLTDMPTADDLREIARQAFEVQRGDRPPGPRHYTSDLCFAQQELDRLGQGDVYAQELRRHQLLQRGSPPEQSLQVDAAIIRTLSQALDTLVGECLDPEGAAKAPTRQALMRARAMLPPYCEHALTKAAGKR